LADPERVEALLTQIYKLKDGKRQVAVLPRSQRRGVVRVRRSVGSLEGCQVASSSFVEPVCGDQVPGAINDHGN
jgi:hypothetical protein